jgi:hypothetical protein
MVTTFLVCIIHPLVTMLAKINWTLACSEGNSKVQVIGPPRPWYMKSGALSCYMCWLTFPKWSRTCGNFLMNSGVNQGNLPRRKLRPFLDRKWNARFHFLVHTEGTVQFCSYLVWHYKLLVCANNITIYPAWSCSAKPMRLWVPSWDKLPVALPTGSGHLPVMMWMDIAFTWQDTSRVGPIEEPQIPEFLRLALMGSSIMEELKKYTNSRFMVPKLLIMSYSNVIGLILK